MADYLQMDEKKLRLELKDLKISLEQLNFAQAAGQLAQNHKFKQVKKDIARVQTALKHAVENQK